MGVCASNLSPEQREAQKRNRALEDQMKSDFHKEQEKVKLLLLGAGESGKSTIFKQMKVLYGTDFTDDEKRSMVPIVSSNVLAAMKTIIEQMTTMQYEEQCEHKSELELIRYAPDNQIIDLEYGNAVKALWTDPGIVATWARRSEFQVVESLKYYFDEIERIMQPTYMPTRQDILIARVRTSGIVTERYKIDGAIFEMYDVGGQRNERKKWIHCFDDVTAVIFVAALSEYDQTLFEDASTNRMTEAIQLFDDICNNTNFVNSSMILFLNKRDLFQEKIATKHIKDVPAFADFDAPLGDFDQSVAYFLNRFLKVNHNRDRTVYHHVTCATDTKNVQVVFNACKDIILRGHLQDAGFMG